MKTRKHVHPSTEKGQSLVELAISLTFILILLAGVVYFGIGLFYYIAMRDAAQEGALYGSMNPDDTAEIESRVANAAGDGLIQTLYDAGELDVTIAYSGAHCEGNGITITVAHDYSLNWLPIGSFISPFIGSDIIQLRAVVTDTILTPACP
jgi:Flp pilus assembly protein TadG